MINDIRSVTRAQKVSFNAAFKEIEKASEQITNAVQKHSEEIKKTSEQMTNAVQKHSEAAKKLNETIENINKWHIQFKQTTPIA